MRRHAVGRGGFRLAGLAHEASSPRTTGQLDPFVVNQRCFLALVVLGVVVRASLVCSCFWHWLVIEAVASVASGGGIASSNGGGGGTTSSIGGFGIGGFGIGGSITYIGGQRGAWIAEHPRVKMIGPIELDDGV